MYNILSFVTVDFSHTVVDNIFLENSRMTETPRSLEERLDELLALQKSQVHDPDAFHPDKDAITVGAWLELSNTAKTQSRYKQRRQLLGYWAVANGRKIEQVRVRSHLTFKIESLVKEADDQVAFIVSNSCFLLSWIKLQLFNK